MLVITGYEAASHSGNVGALVLVPTITSAVKIPCINAGGNSDGRSLAAALALGAEGVTMGIRLAMTKECELADAIKQAWLKATEEDTVIDTAFDGINQRVLRNKAAEDMLKKHFPLFDAISAALYMKRVMKLSSPALVRQAISIKNQETRFGTLGIVCGRCPSSRASLGHTVYALWPWAPTPLVAFPDIGCGA